jgi:hypothetical protein
MTPAEVEYIIAAAAALSIGGFSVFGASLWLEFTPGAWAGLAAWMATVVMTGAAMMADQRAPSTKTSEGSR